MKNFFKILLIQFVAQITCLNMIQAQDSLNLQEFSHYEVKADSAIYPMIEQAYVDIFKSKLNESLCQATGELANVQMTLGLTLKKSKEISDLCKEKNQYLVKYFSRTYTVIFDPERKIPFDSWTNLTGMTYLVFDHQVSYEKLKLMLVHELAILLDSKSKMFYTSFLRLQNKGGTVYFDSSSLETKAFNYAGRDEFHHAFATLRANNVENFLINGKLPSLKSHQECVNDFYQQINFIKNNINANFVKRSTNEKIGPLLDLLNDAASMHYNDENFEEHYKVITNPKIILKDHYLGRVTFCQFMSAPMFATKSYYNMFSNGPRPRTGGGWGDDGGGDSSGDASALVEKDILLMNKRQEPQQD